MFSRFAALGAVVALGAFAAGCTGDKESVVEDFSDLAGQELKTDAPNSRISLIGSLDYNQTSAPVAYKSPPGYRAFKFAGKPGDQVKVSVTSPNGDAVTWLVTNDFAVVGQNDDGPDGSLNSYIEATLPGNTNPAIVTYYIIFRDYNFHRATFTVKLESKQDFFSCTQNSDCEKTHDTCCAIASWIAVRSGTADAYHASLGCAVNPICPRVAQRPDSTVAICGKTSNRCELAKPEEIICAGFRLPSPQECPAGYACTRLDDGALADAPSHCYKQCGGFAGFACDYGYHCVDNPHDDCDPNNGGADCGGLCAPGTGTCDYNDNTYQIGDSFPSADGCNTCNCGEGGSVGCTKRACIPVADYNKKYVGTPEQCQRIRFVCQPGTSYFSDARGCGCQQPNDCPEVIDCEPPTDCSAEQARCPLSTSAL